MRIPIESLKIKALAVLEDAGARVGRQPVEPDPGLRLALAFLYAVSDRDRALFDEFWRAVIDQPVGPSPEALRAQQATVPPLNGIYRAVGIVQTPEIITAIARHRRRQAERRV